MEARIRTLGPARFASPLSSPVSDGVCVPETIVRVDGDIEPCTNWEVAGPRERLFFEPSRLRAAVVTCGGLCPGLNNVLRSLFLHLHHLYGVRELLGIRYGYAGLDPDAPAQPIPLTRGMVLYRAGRYEEAMGFFDRAELDLRATRTNWGEGTPELSCFRGLTEAALGHNGEAEKWFGVFERVAMEPRYRDSPELASYREEIRKARGSGESR